MKSEYRFLLIGSLLLIAYVMEALVKPLALPIATPFEFFTPQNFKLYPFTFTIILIRSMALAMAPSLVFSLFKSSYQLKWISFLSIFGLLQLYAIQEVATGGRLLPLEWSISLSLTGLLLLPQTLFFFLASLFVKPPKNQSTPTQSQPSA